MNIIDTVLITPLSYVISFAYWLTGSYGLAILLFAFISRVILFPVNILAHNNAIRFLRVYPSLDIIKRRFAGDKEQQSEEQYNLFKQEKYNPFITFIPLMLQILLVVGMLQVMYRLLDELTDADLLFAGLNLGVVPSFADPSVALLVPFISGLAALIFCLVQNAISPGAMTQSSRANMGMTLFTVALSLYFALVMPVGVGLYWTACNLVGIAVVMILRALYDPRKLAGEAVAKIEASKKTRAELREERARAKELRAREKQDVARFITAEKRLTFYALSGGQYKFYKNIIEYVLEHSDIIIHYLTNDPNDALFNPEQISENSRLIPYYASSKKTISLMLRLNTDILVTTVPGLQGYQMKRSIVREDIEYIYVPHELASIHSVLREDALDYFDTIFCVGAHRIAEVRRREEMAGLPKKKMVKFGACIYDQLTEAYSGMTRVANERPRILIAPSWQVDNIFELCIDDILDALLGKGYEIILRPHPQFIKMFPERMEYLQKKYSRFTSDGELVFGLDFGDNEQIYTSDAVLTDWSNIAFEFSYVTLKPSIFINTPMKVLNPNYVKYGVDVLNITLRDRVGISVDVENIAGLNDVVAQLLTEKDTFKEQIEQVKREYLYHPGRSGEAGGKYIIEQLKKIDLSS